MVKYNKTIAFLFLFCLFTLAGLTTCEKQKQIVVEPAFYHWKTMLQLDGNAEKYLEKLAVRKLYVKFFDVDKENTAADHEALATLSLSGKIPEQLEIIPCVFITNRSLKNGGEKHLQKLGARIVKKIKAIATKIARPDFKEIQLDCDWTRKTAPAYFELLKIIRKEFGKELSISVTIRLHQVKYPEKTGVPPADKGMLMYYNMGDLELEETANAILDNTIGERYLGRLKNYALPLDIALPLFSWGVVFRDGNFEKLINNLTEKDLEIVSFVKEKGHFYKALEDTYVRGAFVYAGDRIRVEIVRKGPLLQAAKLLRDNRKPSDMIVSFYHLEAEIMEKYAPEFLKEVCGAFLK